MKKYITLIILVFSAMTVKAQFSISYSAGYGDYKMGDIKDIFESSLNNIKYYGVDARLVDDFSSYINHTLDFAYKFRRHEAGLKTTFLTTGGKISYADYSGEYLEKLTLNGYRIALSYRYYLPLCDVGKSGSLSLFGELSQGVTFTRTKYEGHLSIFEETEAFDDSALEKNTTSYTVLPKIGAKVNITPHIGLLVGVGYDLEIGGSIYKSSAAYGYKIEKGVDWSGLRLEAGISYTFGK